MIAHASMDENKRLYGGKDGDQTGAEVTIRTWYNRPWTVVLRYPDPVIRKRLARLARNACKNSNVGFNQYRRLTFYQELKKVKWTPAKICVPCATDCSAMVSALIIAAGYKEGVKALQKFNPALTTSGLRAACVEVGFKALTKSKFLTSDDYLRPGDILLYEGHHVAINLTKGDKLK